MGFFLRQHERRAQLIRDKELDELVEANPDVVFFTECGMRESRSGDSSSLPVCAPGCHPV